MDIDQTFSGKTVFFTGVTGFVGKVFLWKILKEFPDLDSVYCLIRTKKGQNPQDRLQKQVLTSACFGPLRKEIGEEEWKRRSAKVFAVAGDIMDDRLGMSDADFETVASKVNHIVHMAATVNFDERLDISVKMNILGSMRVMALAHRSPKLEAYVHMSTCYVNYARNQRQMVKETVYPLPFDPEEMVKFILAQDPAVMHLVSERVLNEHGFPNTYTMTKSMGEHILERRKGNLPLSIIRPSIVGCAWREPMPGWVDALTAAGGIYLTAGLGILRELHCKGSNIADITPVDYVVNSTIKLLHRTATHYNARKEAVARGPAAAGPSSASGAAVAIGSGKGASDLAAAVSAGAAASAAHQQVSGASSTGTADAVGASMPFVYQSATSSSLNLMRWETAHVAVHSYWNSNPHPKQIRKCDVTFVDNYPEYWMRHLIFRRIPLFGMKIASSLPIIGDPQQKKLVAKLEKAMFRSTDLQRQFTPFMNNQWCFDNTNTNGLDEFLKPEQAKRFNTDVYDINWHAYTVAYSFGMIRYIMRDMSRPVPVLPTSGAEEFLKASL